MILLTAWLYKKSIKTSYNGQRYVTENEVKENVVLDCRKKNIISLINTDSANAQLDNVIGKLKNLESSVDELKQLGFDVELKIDATQFKFDFNIEDLTPKKLFYMELEPFKGILR